MSFLYQPREAPPPPLLPPPKLLPPPELLLDELLDDELEMRGITASVIDSRPHDSQRR